MLIILLTCLMPLIMLEVLLLVRPHMEAFKGNYEAACLSCGWDRSAEGGESLLHWLFAAKKQPVNITSFPASFLDWCQRPCSCNALGWRWKQESWYEEVPAMVLCLGHINRNLFRGAEQEVSVYSRGIRHGNLACFLAYVSSHLYAEQGLSSAVGGSSEAALSLMSPSCGLHEALPCMCCKTQVLYLAHHLFPCSSYKKKWGVQAVALDGCQPGYLKG